VGRGFRGFVMVTAEFRRGMSVFDSAHSTMEREAPPFVLQLRKRMENARLRPRLCSAAPPFPTDTSQQYIVVLLQESMVLAIFWLRGQGLEERKCYSC
jgi:hypothetical protein